MSTPSVAALATAIREQLSTAIAPALADDGQKKLLAIIDHLLSTIAVRAEHEIDWMVAHTADVVELAQRRGIDDGRAPLQRAILSRASRTDAAQQGQQDRE